jgi:hypothetical protein
LNPAALCRRSVPRVTIGQRPAAPDGEGLEGQCVHRVRPHREPVSGRLRFDHVIQAGPAQFGPQPGHQRLQGVTRVGRRFFRPDLVGQGAPRHDTPGLQGEQNEQNAQLAPADVDEAPRPVPHLQRAK